GSDIQPSLRRGETANHGSAFFIYFGPGPKHRFERFGAEAVVKIGIVEVQAGRGKFRVLKNMPAITTAIENETPRLSLNDVRAPKPGLQGSGRTDRAVLPALLKQPSGACNQRLLVERPACVH